MKNSSLESLKSERGSDFVAAIIGCVFIAAAFIKASTPSKPYPVFLFDGIPQNVWSGVVFGVISLELILGNGVRERFPISYRSIYQRRMTRQFGEKGSELMDLLGSIKLSGVGMELGIPCL